MPALRLRLPNGTWTAAVGLSAGLAAPPAGKSPCGRLRYGQIFYSAPMTREARVAVLSRRAAERKVWQTGQYEFEDVISDVDDVAMLTPLPLRPGLLPLAAHHARSRLTTAVGRAAPAAMRFESPPSVEAEIFFAAFAGADELGALPHVRAVAERASVKAAYLIELFPSGVPAARTQLQALRGFDHIFMFVRGALPMVQDITGVPCSYLPMGVDADIFTPQVPAPPRCVDVLSYGRRDSATHQQLRSAALTGQLFYSYDTVDVPYQVFDHGEHRQSLAAVLQRSRYSVVFKVNEDAVRLARTGGEDVLTARYFESAAAGAVMLGSAPVTPDFADCFDWPDAVVEATPGTRGHADVLARIEVLDRDTSRLQAIRSAGMTATLRRHDWAHRWRHVLGVLGVEERPELQARLDRLEARAGQLDTTAAG